MIRRLLILLLIVGCENSTESKLQTEDCSGFIGGNKIVDDCGICGGKLSCVYGDWATTDSMAYYSINEEKLKVTNAFTCSAISGSYNIIEFSDSCLNTNLAIQNEFYSYSFKLSDYDENKLYINIVEVNLESLKPSINLENC
tara:strand:+ start:67 stop:492 length:426 start_codon:yes stop_codon:yes gene_type:complete